MKIDKPILNKLCELAHLKISEQEEKALQKNLSEILSHFNQINQISTKDVEPLISPLSEKMRIRQDNKKDFENKKDLLNQTQNKDGDFFKVPPVL